MIRTRVWAAAAAAVLALGMIPGVTRAEGRKIRAEIPFAFQAGNHLFAAGTYLFEHAGEKPVLVIMAPDGERTALLTHPAGNVPQPAAPGLVFERTGGSHRLAEVWAPGAAHRAGVGRTKSAALLASSRERVRIAATPAVR